MKELHVGDRVYVNTDISLTENHHGINWGMEDQAANNEEVFVIEVHEYGVLVTGDWLYHRNDVTFMSRDIQTPDEIKEEQRVTREKYAREMLGLPSLISKADMDEEFRTTTFAPLTDYVDVPLARSSTGQVVVKPRSVSEQMRDISEEVAGMVEEDDARAVASKARKDIPLYSGCYNYFPLALQEVAKLSKEGNDKHNPGQPLHWNRTPGLSDDHADALARHFVDIGKPDPDMGGITHTASVAWRALALLQEEMEKRDDKS